MSPKFRWRTYRSSSTNEPVSRSFSSRSRARSFPASCCRLTASSLPAWAASSRSFASCSSFARVDSSVPATAKEPSTVATVGLPPLDRSTLWPYEEGEPGEFYYQRYAHPTGVAAERELGQLDGGEALLFSSGTGAATSVVLGLLDPGDTIAVAEGCYYGIPTLFRTLERWGLGHV